MKALIDYLLKRMRRRQAGEFELEEELRFHLEMLAQELRGSGMTTAAAVAASRDRFGDLERVRHQCLAIRRRRDPVNRVLKLALIVMFVAGLVLRMFSVTVQFGRLADLSMAIAVLGHFFLHLRGFKSRHSY
jgi:hypothetical protein